MKDKIIILHGRDIKKASRIVDKRSFAWLYLGQVITQREDISQTLGKGNRYLIGDLLQEVAHEQKQSFLNFVAELGLHQKNKHCWWASNTAYKSPLASNLFLLWCYIAIFDKVCTGKKWGEGKSLLVLVEDSWLYCHLQQRHKGSSNNFSFLSRKSIILELFKSIVKGTALRGYFLLKAVKQIWQTKRMISKSKVPNLATNKNNIYVYSWVLDGFFKENGRFESPYFGRLPELISSIGLNVVYLTPPFLSSTIKSKCLNYGGFKFIFLDQYINLWSLLRSILSILIISSFTSSPLKLLLLREMAGEFLSFSFVRNVLQYYAFKQCLKEIKQKRITIIYPFENQPWEKMLCLAARELDKNIRLVGYQHSMVPLLLLNFFPGAGEADNMPLPHLIVTNGDYTLNLLKNAGYGETKFINGGALRYEYLYKRGGDFTKRERGLRNILVALPYLPSLAQEMLSVIFNAFKDPVAEKPRFIVKFHPTTPGKRMGIQLPPWPEHFQETDRPLSEILKEVDLVIYSSSTIGLEALLGGVPVVRYRLEHTLDLDPLDAFDEEVVKSCSGDNLKQVVLSALKEGSNYLAQQPAENLSNFFSPVDEAVWRQIVRN